MCPRKLLKGKSDFLTVSNYLLKVSDFLLTVSKYLLTVSNFLLTRRKPCRLVCIDQSSYKSRNTNNLENPWRISDDGHKLNGWNVIGPDLPWKVRPKHVSRLTRCTLRMCAPANDRPAWWELVRIFVVSFELARFSKCQQISFSSANVSRFAFRQQMSANLILVSKRQKMSASP